MKSLSIVALAVFLAGCSPKVVDISSAYWAGRNDPQARDAEGWPRWREAPEEGVNIGAFSIPKSDRAEYVGFLWDETGLYGRVFGFEFPGIEIVTGGTQAAVHVFAVGGGWPQRTLGQVEAWRVNAGRRDRLDSSRFRSIDRGWVMKPGQCQSEFWISWQALGANAPPTEPVTIRVKKRILILDTKDRGR